MTTHQFDLHEETLESTPVFSGKLLHVRLDRVRLPNGHEATREYIVHPGAVVVLALFENGDILLERQHRYPLQRDFYELPAGKLDAGETELACARRELLEETGYVAESWRHLTTIHPCIGYSNERLEYFLASGLRHEGQQLDADEFMEVLLLPWQEALQWVRNGRITDTKTVGGLFWLEKIIHAGW